MNYRHFLLIIKIFFIYVAQQSDCTVSDVQYNPNQRRVTNNNASKFTISQYHWKEGLADRKTVWKKKLYNQTFKFHYLQIKIIRHVFISIVTPSNDYIHTLLYYMIYVIIKTQVGLRKPGTKY